MFIFGINCWVVFLAGCLEWTRLLASARTAEQCVRSNRPFIYKMRRWEPDQYRETPKVPSIRFHEKSGDGRGPASVVQCFTDSARDLHRLLVSVELHDPLETLRAGDKNAHAAAEGIGGDPGFVGNRQVLAARFHCGLDPLATVGGYPFGVEDGQRHWQTSIVASCPFLTINSDTLAQLSDGGVRGRAGFVRGIC